MLPPHRSWETARSLVLRYGWNTTCYQIINPGMSIRQYKNGVVGFVRSRSVRVVAGAPVCPETELPNVLDQFEEEGPVVYFGAEERVHRRAEETGKYAISVMGAQPVWSPSSWAKAVDSDASLRAQLNRARNKGVRVSEWTADRATRNPELERVLGEWLQSRGLPTMHFLVEPDTLGFLLDRRVFVAEREGRVIGFTTLCPIPERHGWLTEQFVRGKGAPNGTIELLVDTAIRAVGKESAQMVTMGMVPLARQAQPSPSDPWWLSFTMNWVRAHGRRFYNFDGLEWFKDKFHPDRWDPIYVISTGKPFPMKHLYSVAEAFTGMPPWLAVLKGAAKGLRQELKWLAGSR